MRRRLSAIWRAMREDATAEGLRRYYRDHSRRMGPRIGFSILGAPFYGLFFDWWGAAAIPASILFAEMLEFRLARRVRERPIAPEEVALLHRRSVAQSGVYAAAVSLIVTLIWTRDAEAAPLLGVVLALAMVFDAGFLLSTNRAATLVKIASYAAVVCINIAVDTLRFGVSAETVLQAFAVFMLSYCVAVFVMDVRGARRRHARISEDLAARGEALQQVVAQLTEKERAVRRLALAAEHASDSIIIMDSEQRIEWVNAGFIAATGLSLSDVVGTHPGEIVAPPEFDPDVLTRLLAALEGQRPISVQTPLHRRGGRLVWHAVNLTPIFDAAGTLTHWVSVEHDISELKARETELARSQAEASRLALVAEHARDAIVIYSPEGLIEWVNPAFTTQSGYTLSEAIGRPMGSLIDAEIDSGALEAVRAAMVEERPARAEVHLARKDGTRFWCQASLSPVHRPDGTLMHYISVERDISDLKAREAELAGAQRAAEAAAEAKSSFLATMSHEIRTPMNGIIGTADLLAETPLDADQTRLLRTIASSSEALLRIINDILDLSKLEAGRMEIDAEPFDPVDLVDLCAQLMRPLADRKGLTMEVAAGAGAVEPLQGDPGRMRQILLNLLGNAIKFTEAGTVTLSVDVEPIGPRSRRLRLAVRDTGIGIPPDRLDGVFDAFTQADGTITRRFGGTGLGLSISRRLAEAMGGEMVATSRVGEGSEFSLTLELPPAEEAPRPMTVIEGSGPSTPSPAVGAPVFVPEPTAGPADGPLVLVVEDNATNRFLVERMLTASGYRCVHAEDGAGGVEAYERLWPDAVVMDVSMPVMDGFEATRRIRAAEARAGGGHRPILALTANAHEGDHARGVAAGVTRFLTKPIRKAELRAAVSDALAASQDAPRAEDRRAAH